MSQSMQEKGFDILCELMWGVQQPRWNEVTGKFREAWQRYVLMVLESALTIPDRIAPQPKEFRSIFRSESQPEAPETAEFEEA